MLTGVFAARIVQLKLPAVLVAAPVHRGLQNVHTAWFPRFMLADLAQEKVRAIIQPLIC
jgi:hypothetical protein